MRPFYKGLLISGVTGTFLGIAAWIAGMPQFTGPALTLSLILLAISFQGSIKLKSFSYTTAIFAAVTVSMFYPGLFKSIGNFQLNAMILPLLQIIMFGMGSQLSLEDFYNVIKMPRGVIIGLICQFSIMPFLGITLAKAFGFPPEIAAGIVLVGSAPSGLASNVMNYIARANVPLSVTLTACATLLSPLLTPALMKFLAGQFVPVDFWKMMMDIINLVILPVVAGLIFNSLGYSRRFSIKRVIEILSYALIVMITSLIQLKTGQKSLLPVIHSMVNHMFWFIILPALAGYVFRKLTGGRKNILDQILSFVSMAGIGIIIAIITAAGRESLLRIGILLMTACFLQNILGYLLGYWFCRLIRMDERSCRTIAIEVGMQNSGLASGIALEMGKIATIGLAPAVFGPMMNITGSSLASWWKGKPVPESHKNTIAE